jgi:hypothetical protein
MRCSGAAHPPAKITNAARASGALYLNLFIFISAFLFRPEPETLMVPNDP